MAKEKGDVGILFVRDVDRKLMHEFRGAAQIMQGISMRDAIQDAMRIYIKRFYKQLNKRLDAEFDAANQKKEGE